MSQVFVPSSDLTSNLVPSVFFGFSTFLVESELLFSLGSSFLASSFSRRMAIQLPFSVGVAKDFTRAIFSSFPVASCRINKLSFGRSSAFFFFSLSARTESFCATILPTAKASSGVNKNPVPRGIIVFLVGVLKGKISNLPSPS